MGRQAASDKVKTELKNGCVVGTVPSLQNEDIVQALEILYYRLAKATEEDLERWQVGVLYVYR